MPIQKYASATVLDGGLTVLDTAARAYVAGPTGSAGQTLSPPTGTLGAAGSTTVGKLSAQITPSITLSDSGSGININRVATMAAATDVAVSYSGQALYVVICDGSDTVLYATTCTEAQVTASGTVTVPQWTVTAGQPT